MQCLNFKASHFRGRFLIWEFDESYENIKYWNLVIAADQTIDRICTLRYGMSLHPLSSRCIFKGFNQQIANVSNDRAPFGILLRLQLSLSIIRFMVGG